MRARERDSTIIIYLKTCMGVCTHQLQRHGILNEAAPTKLQRACLLHYLRPAVGDGKGKGVVPFLKNS